MAFSIQLQAVGIVDGTACSVTPRASPYFWVAMPRSTCAFENVRTEGGAAGSRQAHSLLDQLADDVDRRPLRPRPQTIAGQLCGHPLWVAVLAEGLHLPTSVLPALICRHRAAPRGHRRLHRETVPARDSTCGAYLSTRLSGRGGLCTLLASTAGTGVLAIINPIQTQKLTCAPLIMG
eukprot:COSAG03_NODE_1492_length_3984_cov_2.141570_3_plen_178_part_00